MSARYRFEVARAADDAQLRARMAESRMEGDIAVSFRREPSYFAGCRVQGDAGTVVKCVEGEAGRIVGLGNRSTSLAYVNGAPERIGYLSDLRVAPEHRRGTALARGYRFLRRLHDEDPVPFYTTMIYEGNAPAFDTLVGARAGLPEYRDAGRVLTPALMLDFARRPAAVDGVRIVRGNGAHLAAIVAFLNERQRLKQFAPVYRAGDFGAGRFLDLRAEDFFLAVANGTIVATLAAWDQARIRQTHVERYSSRLRALRPLYNLAASVSALKRLPAVGERIPYVTLACLAARDDDLALFRHILRAACNELRRGPWHFAIAGLHESDPLAAAFAGHRRIPAAGRLFTVHFPDGARRVSGLDARVPYVEPGCL